MSHVRVLCLTLLATVAALPLEAATATWDRNPEPAVTGYILSYGTQPGVHSTSINVGNVLTYQFFPPPGRYYVVAQAYDPNGGLSAKSAEIMFDVGTTTNQPPSLTQPVNQTSVQNTAASLTLTATDPEGSVIAYSASGLPPGLSINASSGVISGTVTTVGTYAVTASASDGASSASRTFTWTVAAATVWAKTATWDRNPEPAVTGYILSYGTQSGVHPTSINVGNVLTSQFFPPLGRHYAVVQAYDSTGGLSAKSAEIMFDVGTTTNQPPSLTQPANQTSVQNAAASLTLTATDPDGPVITYGTSGLPPGLSINASSGVISGTVTTVGMYTVTASASDGSLSASRTFTWTVAAATVSGDTTAPTVSVTAPGNSSTVSGISVNVTATAADAVGVAGVQFRLDGVNLGAEDTTAPYSVAWNTTTATNGSHQLTAVARDAAANSRMSAAITVTVNNNRTPTLTQPANQTSSEGSAVSLPLTASDPDGNALSYTAAGLPAGLAINATTGLISGTLTYTSAGTYSVTATVSDGSLSQSRTFSWTVSNTNRAPSLTQPADQMSASNTDVSLQLSASDPDGSPLTYQATGLPPGATINTSTGLISGRLTVGSAGFYIITASASDGSLSSGRTFAWSVDVTDTAVSGDFDGDGRDDPATYRRTTGEWRVWPSASNFVAAAPIVWGVATDVPVPADYDGDGRTDLAVYRPSNGRWYVLLSSTNMQSSLDIQWGNSTDRPIPIDYDNDGRADLALPRFGGFDILLSGSNYMSSITVR
jgi:hypothetical protein